MHTEINIDIFESVNCLGDKQTQSSLPIPEQAQENIGPEEALQRAIISILLQFDWENWPNSVALPPLEEPLASEEPLSIEKIFTAKRMLGPLSEKLTITPWRYHDDDKTFFRVHPIGTRYFMSDVARATFSIRDQEANEGLTRERIKEIHTEILLALLATMSTQNHQLRNF